MKERRFRVSSRSACAGFTLVEIMIVVLIIGVLLNMAAPAFINARDKTQARSCIKNLNNFANAKDEYAMENKMSNGTAITWSNLAPYIRASPSTNPVTGPTCPTKGDAYTYNPIGTLPICTYGGPVGQPLLAHNLTNQF